MLKPNSYIRFLKLVDALNTKSRIRKLDSIEALLLNCIMIDDQAGRSILVGDLINLKLLGSQATLHKRVTNLRSLGYISLIAQSDARKKRVIPTKLSYKRLESLSSCMERATKAFTSKI
jgi:hypothetical protein